MSAALEHASALATIGIVVRDESYARLQFDDSLERRYAYSRDPWKHQCDAGIWRPDDRIAWQCARWLTDSTERVLLVVAEGNSYLKLMQGYWTFRGLGITHEFPESRFGMVDALVDRSVDWWDGFFFASIHFGIRAWAIALETGRVVCPENDTYVCLSHFPADEIPDVIVEHFEYRDDDLLRLRDRG